MHHHHPSSWTTLPQPFHHHTTFNHVIPCPTGDHHHPFNLPPPRSPPASHGGLFKSVVDGLQPGLDPCKVQTDTVKNMTAQEIADAKSIAASKSHSEAERRRRERINNHLTKLRSLLPNTTKTNKASLLAEVIQHVKELKCQTSMIAERIPVPSEIDELTIDNTSDEEGRIVIRASLCCEDRSDLLQDLIKTLKMLRLKTLKAEITTLGRRVKNVLFVTGADYHPGSENQQMVNHWINIIEEALKAIIEKTDDGVDSSFANIKRQKKN
ncbi:transcription factor bHLH30-like [Bidens hawaiensis]|uniref:transcription factor bHLH30-like n=1 Tax=Bidens hawaiensis TaxID=980011 RepID=UPI00404A90A6